ncbi:MAG: hypothetical protein JW712_01345 [Dehalococcoidales bacterium]|nr:hypothetical protein [Dehalococcoidales bacterium]
MHGTDRGLRITSGNTNLEAVLNDTETADAVWETLPYESRVSTWGKEVYFTVPVSLGLELENGRDVVEIGDLAYWPDGNVFCIFYGSTPVSIGDEPRPISPVSVIGRITGDIAELGDIRPGDDICVEKQVISFPVFSP